MKKSLMCILQQKKNITLQNKSDKLVIYFPMLSLNVIPDWCFQKATASFPYSCTDVFLQSYVEQHP